jgi:hypothetical protein
LKVLLRAEVIDRSNFVDELRRAVPIFVPDVWAEGLTYPVANELIRFISAEPYDIDGPNVRSALTFFEQALKDGDSEVRSVVWDAFEGFVFNPAFELYKRLLGPLSQELIQVIISKAGNLL